MPYQSVDKVQKVLEENVFHYAKDSKKAAGRALGTLVEIINFYLLKSWGFNDSVSIERGLAEYGNSEITHNVEYSLHPIVDKHLVEIEEDGKSITANRLLSKLLEQGVSIQGFNKTSNSLISKENVLRNACTVASFDKSYLIASFEERTRHANFINLVQQFQKPYAIFECKRVGVEEGMKKGPQTIEKAKQGAYVARTVSSLQKIRAENGDLHGLIYRSNNSIYIKPYAELVEEVVFSNDSELLRRFVLTVGMVSNHGNWFTAENQNKELKVLGQSYDWLIFLTDSGLSEFIETLILAPVQRYKAVQDAFMASYTGEKTKTQFTKVQMSFEADIALQKFFNENLEKTEKWFNIISPNGKTLADLKQQLEELKRKNWSEILK